MFKLKTTPTVKRQITVILPDDSKGDFTAHLEILSDADFTELLEANDDAALVRRITKKVEGIGDEQGNPLSDDEALEGVLGDTSCIAAISAEYIHVVKGRNLRRNSRR